jgi:hypothetical protein
LVPITKTTNGVSNQRHRHKKAKKYQVCLS